MRRKHELHGDTSNGQWTRLYRIWRGMLRRCLDEKDKNFHNYGGRGISICAEWFDSFAAFREWAQSNGYDDRLSIDRINNDGNYEPSNCRWATPYEQGRNKSNAKRATINGVTKSIREWAEYSGIPARTLYLRFENGLRGKDLIAPKQPTIRQLWTAYRKMNPK